MIRIDDIAGQSGPIGEPSQVEALSSVHISPITAVNRQLPAELPEMTVGAATKFLDDLRAAVLDGLAHSVPVRIDSKPITATSTDGRPMVRGVIYTVEVGWTR